VRQGGRGWSPEQWPGEQNSNRISFRGMLNDITEPTATSNDAPMPSLEPPRQVLESSVLEMAIGHDCEQEHE
jgi:hypothetical protein